MDGELIVPIIITLQNLWRSVTFLDTALCTIIVFPIAGLLAIYIQRRRIYKRLTACGLPTVYWRPKFGTFNPSNAGDSISKLPSSTITNILPRMERLKGPYGMYGTVYGWNTPVIHIAHPVPARAVLSSTTNIDKSSNNKTHSVIQNSSGATKAPAYNHFKNFCGDGVFTADGDDWKAKRAAVTHALLRVNGGYEAAIEKESHLALQRVLKILDLASNSDKKINIVPLLQRATIGLIYRYITHSDLDARIDEPLSPSNATKGMEQTAPDRLIASYLQSITRIRMIILAQSRSIWFLLPRWCYRLFSSMYREEERTMESIRIVSAQACRNALPGSPLAMLQERPIYAAPALQSLSKNILDEAITLLFAGQDTSAATLSWTLHLLSLYPSIQDKLAREVRSVLDTQEENAHVTKKQISSMPYLDAVIKESMRLYPVAPFVVRKLPSDLIVLDETNCSITLPSQSFVCVWIYGMHHHPKFWKSPDDFRPERWLETDPNQRDEGIYNGAYMPFALGPRNCLGQPLAHVILRVFLSQLICKYKFVDNRLSGNGSDPIDFRKDMQAGFTVLPQDGVHLSVLKRLEAEIDLKL
ncbi:hypothetical protein MPSEU_000793100 [Mayamaea pseudoterrestris]|nr:hypothetical protein MPSEU_000793100 [Mayamaea pseudoterrestris]